MSTTTVQFPSFEFLEALQEQAAALLDARVAVELPDSDRQ